MVVTPLPWLASSGLMVTGAAQAARDALRVRQAGDGVAVRHRHAGLLEQRSWSAACRWRCSPRSILVSPVIVACRRFCCEPQPSWNRFASSVMRRRRDAALAGRVQHGARCWCRSRSRRPGLVQVLQRRLPGRRIRLPRPARSIMSIARSNAWRATCSDAVAADDAVRVRLARARPGAAEAGRCAGQALQFQRHVFGRRAP